MSAPNGTPTGGRPRVVCHMMGSVDGRIMVGGWPLDSGVRGEYERIHDGYGAEAWMCGRVTMEEFAGATRSDDEVKRQEPSGVGRDFRAPGTHESFAFALDPSGRLAWESGEIDGDHVVAIVTGRVSQDYLSFLRERGVSYLYGGDEHVDLELVLETIREEYGVRTLMLEGGGGINGSMLRAGLIDELSLLLAPVGDGRVGTASVFDVDGGDMTPRRLALESVERCAGGALWLRYRIGGAS